jgi:hypothetical protein
MAEAQQGKIMENRPCEMTKALDLKSKWAILNLTPHNDVRVQFQRREKKRCDKDVLLPVRGRRRFFIFGPALPCGLGLFPVWARKGSAP